MVLALSRSLSAKKSEFLNRMKFCIPQAVSRLIQQGHINSLLTFESFA